MSTTHNKKIAEELIALNTNIFLWNREHIEKSFNINGKTKEGELTIRQFHVLTFIKNGVYTPYRKFPIGSTSAKAVCPS